MKRITMLAAVLMMAWTARAAAPPFFFACEVAPKAATVFYISEWQAAVINQMNEYADEQIGSGNLKGTYVQSFHHPAENKYYRLKVTWQILPDGSSLSCVSWEE